MRVIGRSKSGQIVGCFERCGPRPGAFLVQRLDAGLQPVEQTCLEGFRESVAWLHRIGAIRFECIESDAEARGAGQARQPRRGLRICAASP